MIKNADITASMARVAECQQERFQGLQIILSLMAKDGMTSGWKPIIKIYVSENKEQLEPQNRDYIYIAFDFIPGHDLRLIIKISNKTKTTHFPDFISRN